MSTSASFAFSAFFMASHFSLVFAAAASLVALLAVASIFSRPMPKPSLAAWVEPPLTVRLAPYDPADWYSPLACEEAPREAGCAAEPFCTREALAMLRLR